MSPWLSLFAVVLAAGSLGACRDSAADAAPPPALSFTGDRVSFRPTSLPRLQQAVGFDQPISSLLNVTRRMDYGDYQWSERDVPPGKIWILVDLDAQTMSVFRGMHEIGTAVTLYGVDDKPTPTGRFTVLEKRQDHWSNLYDAPMPYTLRLTWDGIAIHGSDVREGAGTHGCLGVPLDFGRHLFEEAKVGTEVLVVRGVTADQGPILTRG